jgi:sodium-dependent phosphate cotransporter
MANNALIEKISTGEVTSCSESYPVHCEGLVSYETCEAGLIGCNKKTNLCPAFFQEGANKEDDMVSGWVCLIIALFLLILCLVGLVMLLRKLLINTSTRIIYKATNINPYIAMMIGCGVTVLVQSSSITTSALIPLAGIGVLPLENMYPLVIGADIGTAFTALMAASEYLFLWACASSNQFLIPIFFNFLVVSSSVGSLQIALVHLFFNVNGALMWVSNRAKRCFSNMVAFSRLPTHQKLVFYCCLVSHSVPPQNTFGDCSETWKSNKSMASIPSCFYYFDLFCLTTSPGGNQYLL